MGGDGTFGSGTSPGTRLQDIIGRVENAARRLRDIAAGTPRGPSSTHRPSRFTSVVAALRGDARSPGCDHTEGLTAIADLAAELERLARAIAAAPPEPERLFPEVGFGFSGRPEEQNLIGLDDAALRAWEESDLPKAKEHTREGEVAADVLEEDVYTGFPLHWRTWDQTWRYLFKLTLAAEALGCRPGDTVLDCAAGTGWVAEMFNRLGIRVVSLDFSLTMLQHGRQRLSMDRRLDASVATAFVAGDVMQLPFPDSTFDGVICMNALHHVASYRQALSEIFRVLRTGGRAVFSEPGPIHAREPLSQARMREYGIFEKNVPLPLIGVLARQVGFDRVRVMPLSDPNHYTFDYAAGPQDHRAIDEMWKAALLFSHRSHSNFVLEKGDPRPLDSRLPASSLFEHQLRAEINVLEPPEPVTAAGVLHEVVRVRNAGDVTWLAASHRFGGNVCLGVKVYDESGRMLRADMGRAPIPRDLARGDVVDMKIIVPLPLPPGRYRLRHDMVIERLVWFEHRGSPVADRWVDVLPMAAPIAILEAAPSVPSGAIFTDRVSLTNTTRVTWYAQGVIAGEQVSVGVRVLSMGGTVLRDDLGRSPLPRDLAPGESIDLDVRVTADLAPGRYRLRYDVVLELLEWLQSYGAPVVEREIEVLPARELQGS